MEASRKPHNSGSSQTLFREVNDRIRAFSDVSADGRELELVCECERGCLEHLSITREEYELVRRFPTRFVMRPDHVSSASERQVERGSSYVVVEKTGLAAVLAVQLDPRRLTTGRNGR